MKQKRKPQKVYVRQYTLVDELMASPTQPLEDFKRVHHLTAMWQGLAALETEAEPTKQDWRLCSDAVNMMETFTTTPAWRDCTGAAVEITDRDGLLMDAITALAMAGKRHRNGKPLRLDAAGIFAVRAILEDYAALLDVLPAREVVRCHRLTERRLAEILQGKRAPHDVEVIDI